MGIQSLTSLVNNNSHLVNDYKLRNTRIVIDGSNIAYRIYENCRIDSRYGGDYKSFEKYCKKFINNLRRCKVEPVVFFDGSYDNNDLKFETTVKRAKKRISDAKSLSFGGGSGVNVLPLFTLDVMRNVLIAVNVKCHQCAGEADAYIASESNRLKCPLISQDSDFYVFDIKFGFISFDSIDFLNISDCYDDEGPFLESSIYYLENLLSCFKNLDKSLLPLFATIMGNDFVKSSLFSNFIDHVPREITKRKYRTAGTRRHDNMIGILNWLRGKSLQQSIESILSSFKKEKRDFVRKNIENSLEMYRKKENNSEKIDDVDDECRKTLKNLNFPEWFVDSYVNFQIPISLLSITCRRRYFFWTLIEDFSRPSVWVCCRNVRKAAYRILLPDCPSVFEYIRKGGELIKYEVSLQDFSDFPDLTLKSVEFMRENERKTIFYQFISLNSEDIAKINRFPSFLRQFLCITSFWMRNDDVSVERNHFDALIVCLFFRLSHYCIDEEWLKCEFFPNSDDAKPFDDVLAMKKYDFSPKSGSGCKKKSYTPKISVLHSFNQWQAIAFSMRFLLAALNLQKSSLSVLNMENCYSGRLCYNLAEIFSTCNNFRGGLKKIFNSNESDTLNRLEKFRTAILDAVSVDLIENRPKKRSKNDGSKKKISTEKRPSVVEIDGENVELDKENDEIDELLSNNMFAALKLL